MSSWAVEGSFSGLLLQVKEACACDGGIHAVQATVSSQPGRQCKEEELSRLQCGAASPLTCDEHRSSQEGDEEERRLVDGHCGLSKEKVYVWVGIHKVTWDQA
jgi:hypothetical protein